MTRPKTVSLLLLALALIALPPARAQSSPLTGRLPSGTVLYVYWRGADSVARGSRNPLVALWNDPQFAPMRRLIEQGLVDGIARNPRLARIPPSAVPLLLGRPLIFGLRLTAPPASSEAGAESRAEGFLVIDAGAKLGEQVRAALVGAGPKAAGRVQLTPTGFLVASGDPSTLADLARRFDRARPPASDSLASVPEYEEARAELAGRPPIEFFMRVPAISALHPQKTPNFDVPVFLHALKIERVHLLCGAIDLDAPTAFARFSVLGNTSPGSLFDLLGPNARSFATLAAAPAGSSFNAYHLDLGSVATTVLSAFSDAANPNVAARVKMVAGPLLTAIVPALAGEYATIRPQPSPSARRGPGRPLFAVAIHRKAAEQLFATQLSLFVQPAGSQGAIRYFRTTGVAGPMASRSSAQSKSGEKREAGRSRRRAAARHLFIALTPHLLLASTDQALVRRRALAVTSAAPRPGLAAAPRFRAARARFPAELTGFTYADFARVQWTRWLERAAAQMAKNKKDPHAAERAAAVRKWARAGGGAVLARHLHWFAVGAWKNASGVHWRGDLH